MDSLASLTEKNETTVCIHSSTKGIRCRDAVVTWKQQVANWRISQTAGYLWSGHCSTHSASSDFVFHWQNVRHDCFPWPFFISKCALWRALLQQTMENAADGWRVEDCGLAGLWHPFICSWKEQTKQIHVNTVQPVICSLTMKMSLTGGVICSLLCLLCFPPRKSH